MAEKNRFPKSPTPSPIWGPPPLKKKNGLRGLFFTRHTIGQEQRGKQKTSNPQNNLAGGGGKKKAYSFPKTKTLKKFFVKSRIWQRPLQLSPLHESRKKKSAIVIPRGISAKKGGPPPPPAGGFFWIRSRVFSFFLGVLKTPNPPAPPSNKNPKKWGGGKKKRNKSWVGFFFYPKLVSLKRPRPKRGGRGRNFTTVGKKNFSPHPMTLGGVLGGESSFVKTRVKGPPAVKSGSLCGAWQSPSLLREIKSVLIGGFCI